MLQHFLPPNSLKKELISKTNAAAAAAAKSLQLCPTLCDPIHSSPPGSPVLGILQANTGVGCHFLLQCMKVKSQSEVAQSCPTLHDRMDCSLPGSSIHGIFQARVLEWVAIIRIIKVTIANMHRLCTMNCARYSILIESFTFLNNHVKKVI